MLAFRTIIFYIYYVLRAQNIFPPVIEIRYSYIVCLYSMGGWLFFICKIDMYLNAGIIGPFALPVMSISSAKVACM